MSSDEGWESWNQSDLRAIGLKLIVLGGEIERVTEAVTAMLDGTEAFPVEDMSNISSRSRESRGLAHSRPVVDVESYVLPQGHIATT